MGDVIYVCSTCHKTTSIEHRDAILWEKVGGHRLCPVCSYKLTQAVRKHPSNRKNA